METTPVIAFAGEFDLSNAAWFGDEMQRALGSGRSLVVDASEITYLDSTVLTALIRVYRLCRKREGKLVVACPRPTVQRVLQVTGLAQLFSVQSDVNSALVLASAA